jgi:PAS domain S-box-containing protein
MSVDEEGLIKQLAAENLNLKQKVKELETELEKKFAAQSATKAKSDLSQVIKLIERKDRTLAAYAVDLEEKSKKLQETVEELRKKNEELSLWITSLRLYQDIFENEPSAMIGLNKAGHLVLFNKSATTIIGDSLPRLLLRPVEDIVFDHLDPGIPEFVRNAIATESTLIRTVQKGNKETSIVAIPLKSGAKFRGILVKISIK